MSADVLWVLGYVGLGLLVAAVLLLLDTLFLGMANRFAGRADQYRHRIGTQLPRVPQ